MKQFLSAAVVAAALAPAPVLADDITDALNAAISAYESGEIQDALGEIAYATQLLNDLQSEGLTSFLPEPLDGWSREVEENPGQGLGFMGGGSMSQATYSGPDGRFTILMVADNPMIGAMAGVLSNPAMMSTMGRIARIGGESFLDADGELSGLIGGRVLIQASGASTEAMAAHLETVDFGALEGFGG